MGFARARLAGLIGVAIAGTVAAGAPIAADAQVTCAPGTTAVVRAIGNPSAPVLVPAQVPVTICSQNGSVVAVIPAFRTVGPASAPMIIPVPSTIKTCVPTVVATTPASGTGPAPALQFAQVGSNVATLTVVGGGTVTVPVISSVPVGATIVPSVVTATQIVVVSSPAAFTCF